MTFMFLFDALIKETIFVYAAKISLVLFDCCVISFVPSINMTTSGFALANQPCRLFAAIFTAKYPEWPSWCLSQSGFLEDAQFCGLEVLEPTNWMRVERLAVTRASQTRGRQQVISVMESPRGTGCVRGWRRRKGGGEGTYAKFGGTLGGDGEGEGEEG
jgi:hypothetical protein